MSLQSCLLLYLLFDLNPLDSLSANSGKLESMSENFEDLLGFAPPGSGEFDLPAENPKPGMRSIFDKMIDPNDMLNWMAATATLPLDSVDEAIVNQTYSAATWLFRSYAIRGDLKATQSIKIWLDWAKPIKDAPKREKAPKPSKGSVAFLPRIPTGGEE